jgi:hypothetical protein
LEKTAIATDYIVPGVTGVPEELFTGIDDRIVRLTGIGETEDLRETTN